jgi:hypothetical protein
VIIFIVFGSAQFIKVDPIIKIESSGFRDGSMIHDSLLISPSDPITGEGFIAPLGVSL